MTVNSIYRFLLFIALVFLFSCNSSEDNHIMHEQQINLLETKLLDTISKHNYCAFQSIRHKIQVSIAYEIDWSFEQCQLQVIEKKNCRGLEQAHEVCLALPEVNIYYMRLNELLHDSQQKNYQFVEATGGVAPHLVVACGDNKPCIAVKSKNSMGSKQAQQSKAKLQVCNDQQLAEVGLVLNRLQQQCAQ